MQHKAKASIAPSFNMTLGNKYKGILVYMSRLHELHVASAAYC